MEQEALAEVGAKLAEWALEDQEQADQHREAGEYHCQRKTEVVITGHRCVCVFALSQADTVGVHSLGGALAVLMACECAARFVGLVDCADHHKDVVWPKLGTSALRLVTCE